MASGSAPIGFQGVEMAVHGSNEYSQDHSPPGEAAGSQLAGVGSPAYDSELTPLKREVAQGSGKQTVFFKDGKRRIDYVLVYQVYEEQEQEWRDKREQKRQDYFEQLKGEGLELEEDHEAFDKKSIFVKVHAPWKTLSREAEALSLKMPREENNYVRKGWWDRMIENMRCSIKSPFNHGLEDMQNYITLPFSKAKQKSFIGIEDKDKFFTPAQRSLMVNGILVRTPYSREKSKVGFERLLANKAIEAAYPLHSGGSDVPEDEEQNERSVLRHVWARWGAWYKYQPLDYIRRYFGEKVGIYFCWLGLYTTWLWPAAIVGLLVFIIGCGISGDDIPSKEICDDNLTTLFYMCPLCDVSCDFYFLKETCYYARASFLFDNGATVFFAAFMCLWAVFFLEMWKRTEVGLAYRWDVLGYEEQQELPRAVFEATVKTKKENPVTGRLESFVPTVTQLTKLMRALSVVFFFIAVVIAAVIGVVVYRITVVAAMNENNSLRQFSSIATSITAAVIQVILITVLDKVYQYVAVLLTEWELHRTQTEHEDSFTFKMFLFQFVNYYSSVFYIAFFKGKFTGYPYNYNELAGARLDECGPGGCMIELTQQLAIVMVGKQVVNNFVELLLPKLKAWWRRRDTKDEDPDDDKCVQRWEEDYDLADLNQYGLFAEYLEMVIQYGFITLFVAAFPLAPVFALLNNLIEIRLDAYKFITTLRRPVALRAQDIGIWYSILDGVSKFAVISNAFIIAVTSEFIPRTLYSYTMSPTDDLKGFVNFSLAYAPIRTNFDGTLPESSLKTIYNQVHDHQLKAPGSNALYNSSDTCRYRSYRQPDGTRKVFWWEYLTSALAFVIVFEHVIFAGVALVAWLIPDVPADLKEQMQRVSFLGEQALREREVESEEREARPTSDV
ncbi:anoctamin-7-like [Corticium candelabrum]|uniref:anoctamin-7-like n=1 Tax=Corticium candelabrum TaxID=121492 RepID=UPI002E25515A|nr:anoctamin-7-like [Corticium candelabrum]